MQLRVLRGVLALAVLSGTGLTAYGQADPIKFGKPDPQDFEAKNFVADSAAEAVILCDFGRSRFEMMENDFKVVYDRVLRIKILKKSGYDWATLKVPLYKKDKQEEKLVNLRGYTYNMVNGQLTKDKLESSAVFSEQRSTNTSVRKFTLPNVRVGSVIEVAYTVNSDFLFNFQDWQFQHSIPVRWSEYRAGIPEYFDYKMLMQGYEALTVQERTENTGQFTIRFAGGFTGESSWSGGSGRQAASSETVTARVTNYRWAMQNVPAFNDEPFMTTSDDYVSRIDFELAGVQWPNEAYRSVAATWEKINTSLLDDETFGAQLKRGGFLKEKVAAIMAQHTDLGARVAAVHQLVRQSIKHNGQNRFYATSTLRHAYDQHTGNAADVNLLLIALLRDAGLEANPVLLSTRDNGAVNQNLPLLSKFNYVVAHVMLPDKQEMLVDATEELLPCGTLPTRCLSGQGRLIMPKAEDSRWIDLQPNQRYVEYRKVDLKLDEHGALTGNVHQEHGGYEAQHQRERLRTQGEKKYMEELAKGHDNWSLGKYAFHQQDDLQKPLSLDYEFATTGNDAAATTLYLNPIREFAGSKNPFIHEDRRFPVNFGAGMEETTMLTITLPAGYVTEELPKQAIVELPDNGGRFMYSVTNLNGAVQVISRMNLRKPVYSAEEYASLREFYTRMLAKHGEQIVVKKKS
ncbi:DUF3857 domain-containing protein [Hymenobacter cavernae]|uniref:DUF3857 domain-containing protein n=1 Tax=Hymenobacter cavernae TaxID=2044852 RepID=A0ABQ1UML6_9BACT|nr:DUF3857 domain-containing protein [Hymenobacter cavernae]GGF20802.1 hypothetical protein GCM10011383_35610 [Hymenobacter cavernae]